MPHYFVVDMIEDPGTPELFIVHGTPVKAQARLLKHLDTRLNEYAGVEHGFNPEDVYRIVEVDACTLR